MVRRSSWLEYPRDIDLRLSEGSRLAAMCRLWAFFVKAIQKYDVFHFNWGMSLLDHRAWSLNLLDLPLLKRMGKRIVVTFQGCDARIKTLSRERFSTTACAECDVTWCTSRMDERRQRRIRKVVRYADKAFALNPDLLHFVPEAELLPYASVDLQEWKPSVSCRSHGSSAESFRVLHLATNRSIKGTRYVEAACTRLRNEGVPVELQVVERVPHARVKELIERADVVVDQLLVGWYGASAVEAMALEKPVLCYLREDDLKRFVPFHDQIPIVRTTKETLADCIRSLFNNPSSIKELGAAGRRFVEAWHDPIRIAKRCLAAYSCVPPP